MRYYKFMVGEEVAFLQARQEETRYAGFVEISKEEYLALGGGAAIENHLTSEPNLDIETLHVQKLAELSDAGNAAIIAGVDVALPSTGETEHYALQETDQINLSTALAVVNQGAAGYPYHADGQLCRMYPAPDVMAISQAAIKHKLYHTTYCNHLLVWARRAETVEELEGITYGAELPPDLSANLAAVLAAAGGVADA